MHGNEINNQVIYFLKIQRDFFEQDEVKLIEKVPNGEKYVLFYFKLLMKSIDDNGKLLFTNDVPYDDYMLAQVTETDIDVVRTAVQLFIKFNLMEIQDGTTYFMTRLAEMLGSVTRSALYKRAAKEKKRLQEQAKEEQGLKNSNQIPTNVKPSETFLIDNKIINKNVPVQCTNTLRGCDVQADDVGVRACEGVLAPSLDEIKAECEKQKYITDAERFFTYYNRLGWVDSNGEPIKNWKAVLAYWNKEDVRNDYLSKQMTARERAMAETELQNKRQEILYANKDYADTEKKYRSLTLKQLDGELTYDEQMILKAIIEFRRRIEKEVDDVLQICSGD